MTRVHWQIAVGVVVLLAAASRAVAQTPDEVRRMFEGGRYEQVAAAALAGADPAVLYLAGQSQQKRGATGEALELYGQLAARPAGDAWQLVGQSARQLLEAQPEDALASARQAVATPGAPAEAHYQLGLVLAGQQAWADAALAFERAAELAPAHAYAHYYAGLMNSRARRIDRMGLHFEQFLKLAPEAPERPEVMQIMRTVRGR